jgi:Spy/CpxP family protein refolding chaperone
VSSHFRYGSRTAPSRAPHALALVAMTFACLATTLAAQGRRRAGPPDQSAPARNAVAPILWEPEQIFPLAIAHASDLKLSDEQRTQIETIAAKMRASNAPILVAIDTLRPPRIQLPDPNNPSAPTASPAPPSPDSIAVIVARRHALGEARAQLHENIRLARDQMNQLMTPEQQTRLQALEASARSSAERGDPGGSSGVGTSARVGRQGGQGPP